MDPSGNYIIRRGNAERIGEQYYEGFRLNQFYNAVEDEQIYMDEYTSLINNYNNFITNGNMMFSRMEQTLRENVTRTLVRQSFYYNGNNRPTISSTVTDARAAVAAPTAPAPAPAPAPATPAPAPAPAAPATPAPAPRITEALPRLLSRYLNTEMSRDQRGNLFDNANVFSMLYTIPLETRRNGIGGAPTNHQIQQATVNNTFGNIVSPVNATCPISRDEFNDESEITMIRGCNHIFNQASLREWFVSHSTCPLCRGDIREYRPPPTEPVNPSSSNHHLPPANLSIDRIDNNEFTFSYDLPVSYNSDQIYQDVINTVDNITNYRRNHGHGNDDDDDDIMEVD
jgi:hypothetical protein